MSSSHIEKGGLRIGDEFDTARTAAESQGRDMARYLQVVRLANPVPSPARSVACASTSGKVCQYQVIQFGIIQGRIAGANSMGNVYSTALTYSTVSL